MTVGLVITLENRIENAIPDIVNEIDREIFTLISGKISPVANLG